jgi:hypothetical protein
MQATAAGAAEFCREVNDAARAAEADSLLGLAERIEAEKVMLRHQIEAATVEAAERQMCAEVDRTTPRHCPHRISPRTGVAAGGSCRWSTGTASDGGSDIARRAPERGESEKTGPPERFRRAGGEKRAS